MTAERLCDHCSQSFTARRPHARFCSDSCRAADWAEARENSRQIGGERVVDAPRRPSREGRGAKVYLTSEELSLLAAVPRQRRFRGDAAAGRLMQKLDRAAERINRRERR